MMGNAPREYDDSVMKELDEAREIILDLFSQACFQDGKYNHQCLSSYENAQAYLIEHKMIKPSKCRYKL